MKNYAWILLVLMLIFTHPINAENQTEEDKVILAAQKLMKASIMIDTDVFFEECYPAV